MFCTKCGAQNPGGSAFCVNCGNSLKTAGNEVQPQVQYTQPQGYAPQPAQNAYAGYAPRKNKKGLMIGLIIGGVVLVAGIVVLLLLLNGGSAASGIVGTWYEQSGFAGTLNFKTDGTFEMTAMGVPLSGEYTFDSKNNTGEMSIMGQSTEFSIEGGLLNLDGATYTRDYVKQQDLSDLDLSDFNMSDFGLD